MDKIVDKLIVTTQHKAKSWEAAIGASGGPMAVSHGATPVQAVNRLFSRVIVRDYVLRLVLEECESHTYAQATQLADEILDKLHRKARNSAFAQYTFDDLVDHLQSGGYLGVMFPLHDSATCFGPDDVEAFRARYTPECTWIKLQMAKQ